MKKTQRSDSRAKRTANHRDRMAVRRIRKASHVLPPETCAIFIPERGYLRDYEPRSHVGFTDRPELASFYTADVATRLALALCTEFKFRPTLRPYRPHPGALIASAETANRLHN